MPRLLNDIQNSGEFKKTKTNPGALLTLIVKLADYGKNRNNRIYSKDLWRKVIESDYVQEQLKLKRFFGEMNHPEGAESTRSSIDMNNISHNIVDLDLRDDGLYGTLDILDTPAGRIAKTLLDYGSALGISSRGGGSLDTDTGEVIPDTYKCFCWDLVNYQSSYNCVLQESVQVVSEEDISNILKDYRSLYESTDTAVKNDSPAQKIVQQLIKESISLNKNANLNE